jgi:cobalt-zinc-cadmium efflux system outer membrane protein
MVPRSKRWLLLSLAAWVVSGCCYAVREQADRQVCDIAAKPLDVATPPVLLCSPMPAARENGPSDQARGPSPSPSALTEPADGQVEPAAAQQPAPAESPPRQPPPISLRERLKVPPEIPGANLPLIRQPRPQEPPAVKEAFINRLYPPLPPLGPDQQPLPGPNGQPLALADLQQLAMSNSPLIRQAAADVAAAKGAAIQAGAYPNPNVGYQSDTAGTSGTAGFQGVFIEQVIKTAGKLKLAQAAATMDLLNSELALRRTRYDLMSAVRNAYFAVLVAQETVKINAALTRLSDEVFRVQVDLLRGGQGAAYEPLQLRVLALQARGTLVQARNAYTAAWKQLAATLGLPALPPTELAGRADMPMPVFHYDTSLARVLANHTDVLTAQNTLQRNRYNLRLTQVTPIPDLSLHLAVEKDFSMPPFAITHSLQLGGPLPVWDQNKGNVIQSQGALLRAVEQQHQVRDDLTNRLAAAFQQYSNNRVLVAYYHNQILPDQVRAYRTLLERAQQDPAVQFIDLFTAQQTLASVITTYVTTLGTLWTSVVSVADLMQIDDLYLEGEEPCAAPIPDLEHLAPLPCCHPCSPLPDPQLKGARGDWPPAIPETPERRMPPAENGAELRSRATPTPDLPRLNGFIPVTVGRPLKGTEDGSSPGPNMPHLTVPQAPGG